MDSESVPQPPHLNEVGAIGLLGVFTSSDLERAFQKQHFRADLQLSRLLIGAGMLRVTLFLLADYQHFGAGPVFWRLLASRCLFVLVSIGILCALRRSASPAAAAWLFTGWGLLIIALTVGVLSGWAPSNNGLLFMSFSLVVVTYCATPLPLRRQAALTLLYSSAVLYACRQASSTTLLAMGATHALSHLFGAVTSWRLNHRRRQLYLGSLREAQLRLHLEAALAAVRTLRGQLCICAWCKRIRDDAAAWESVEDYVQSRTEASFSHGVCPECLQTQVKEFAQAGL